MRKIVRNIVDYCLYWWLTDYIQNEHRINIYLQDTNSGEKKETKMYYVPNVDSFIRFADCEFHVKKVSHAMYGHVAWLEGTFIKT